MLSWIAVRSVPARCTRLGLVVSLLLLAAWFQIPSLGHWVRLPVSRSSDATCLGRASDDAAIASRLRYRRQRIRSACDTHSDLTNIEVRWSGDYHVDSIMWRKIPKCASTYVTGLLLRRILGNSTFKCESASHCFNLLTELVPDRGPHDELVKDMPAGKGGSLLVVRNPFPRLVSAFVDKIARNDTMRIWTDIWRASGQANTTSRPTFSAFVDYIIWQDQNYQVMDAHWAPQDTISVICQCDFQYIVQMERMEEEMPYVVRMLGLEEEAKEPIQVKNTHHRKYNATQMMRQLSDEQRDSLREIYLLDIMLFSG